MVYIPALQRELIPASYRGVSFHVTEMKSDFEHAQATHKRPYQDTEPVEQLGRKNRIFTFTIPFINRLFDDDIEQYPSNFRKFEGVFAEKQAGILQHPEYGSVRVKPVKFSSTWKTQNFDGVNVEVSFVEAPEQSDELSDFFKGTNTVTVAARIDTYLRSIQPPLELSDSLQPDLLSSIKKLDGTINQAVFQFESVFNKIDGVITGLLDLQTSLEGLGTQRAYQAIVDVEELMAKLFGTKATLVTKNQREKVKFVQVTADSSLQDFCNLYLMTIDELANLNPSVVRNSTVTAGSVMTVFARGKASD